MPTGNKKVNLYNKRTVPQEGWKAYFFEFLDAKINDTTRATFLSPGVLDDEPIGLSSSVNDTITFDLTNADRGIDDAGHILDLSNLASSLYTSYPFENATGDTYYFGFRYQTVPDDIENNPRSGIPKYPWYLETIGELDNPDNVTDNTTDITLEIDGILENGVDHSGRPFSIWLINPVSPVDSIGYYSGTVAYSGGINKVVVPYTPTAGPLGQTAPAFPISLTVLDYVVHVQGISWFKNTDISAVGDYVFVGTALGNGPAATPTVFDISGQSPVFFISLDRAYRANSLDTPAPGRTIVADKWAVRIKQSATVERSYDPSNTAFEVDKTDETVSRGASFKALLGGGSNISLPFSSYRILQDGTNLQPDEAVSMLTSVATITFDRGAIDLTQFEDDYLAMDGAICIVEGSLNNVYDGAYFIDSSSILIDRFDAINLDGSSPAFIAGTTGTLNIYLPSLNALSHDWLDASHSDVSSLVQFIPNVRNGFELISYGEPVDPEQMYFNRAGSRSEGDESYFYQMPPGRIRMKSGGNTNTNFPRWEGSVFGWAQFQSDKRDTSDLTTNWVPVENNTEWGFDYRASDFAKPTSDEPGYQLAYTSRIPFKWYDSGSDDIQIEEPFTQSSGTVLQLTRGGANTDVLPSITGMHGGVLAEVQFGTPNVFDGVYVVVDTPAADTVQLLTVNGSSPNFPAGTGVIRFYGGSIFGPVKGDVSGGSKAWVQHIVPPTKETGGLRITHNGAASVSSTDERYFMQFVSGGTEAFSVRDGGIMFGRAITTRTTHALTQWDQVDTALVTTDLYTGTLAQIDSIDLSEGTYDLLLPAARGSCNVIKQNGGATWAGVVKMFNHLKFATGQTGGTPNWDSPLGSAHIVSNFANTEARIPISVPQGATLNSINLRCDPLTGDGTSASMGVNVYRKDFTSTTGTSLISTGILYLSSASLQTFVLTLDQNNVINTDQFAYWIEIKASDTAGDLVYSARGNYDIDNLGENWFDCF